MLFLCFKSRTEVSGLNENKRDLKCNSTYIFRVPSWWAVMDRESILISRYSQDVPKKILWRYLSKRYTSRYPQNILYLKSLEAWKSSSHVTWCVLWRIGPNVGKFGEIRGLDCIMSVFFCLLKICFVYFYFFKTVCPLPNHLRIVEDLGNKARYS